MTLLLPPCARSDRTAIEVAHSPVDIGIAAGGHSHQNHNEEGWGRVARGWQASPSIEKHSKLARIPGGELDIGHSRPIQAQSE